jgi:DNA-binding response OmpR family regulator
VGGPGERSVVSRNVLLIEDDFDIAGLLAIHLQDLGCKVESYADGQVGLIAAVERGPWSLVVLDLGLPNVDGLEICRRLRSPPAYTPILMLTARAAESERVLGLELGADDYMTKPFSVVEFSARVKAILRRVERLSRPATAELQTLQVGDLFVDLNVRTVRRRGIPLGLTAKEFDLLAHLMRHPGRVFSRAQLLDDVWGTTHDAFEHTVNSHINRLRAKLEPDPERPRYVVTVWGVGYRLRAPHEPCEA